uniref:LIM zinc-binding domain-containing protein n=1 Tax=Parastrongyloides trichosuri TaxID=131310 RepID=A0A0N4ZSG3_PARTI
MVYIVKTKSEVVTWNKNFDNNDQSKNDSNIRNINIVRNSTPTINTSIQNHESDLTNTPIKNEQTITVKTNSNEDLDTAISQKSAFIPIKKEGLFKNYFNNSKVVSNYDEKKITNGTSRIEVVEKISTLGESNSSNKNYSSFNESKKDIKMLPINNNDSITTLQYKNYKGFSSDNKRYIKSKDIVEKHYHENDFENQSNNMVSMVDTRRSMSRASNYSDMPSQHVDAIHSTLAVLKDDVEKTTEIIRRKQQEQLNEQKMFNANMEVNGRISMIVDDDWLSTRLKSISRDDMRKELDKVKHNQQQNVVGDTLAALVYDVEATTEVLRRAGQRKPKKTRVISEEVEYRLKLSPAPEDDDLYDPKPVKTDYQSYNEPMTMETIKNDYGVEITENSINQRHNRARSQTPRRTIAIESSSPPPMVPHCAYCSEEIEGAILTALAPNAERAQKFHPYHFMCIYCQKALSLRGTYREHEKKPYCHECFYKLYNGLQYCPDMNQSNIEKLI